MPNMPDHVYKGPIFKRVEQAYATPEGRAAMLAALLDAEGKGTDALVDIGSAPNLGGSGRSPIFLREGEPSPPPGHSAPGVYRDQVEHVRKHWFQDKSSSSDAWWNTGKDLGEIIRQGAMTALKLAGSDPQSSVDVLWACFGEEVPPGQTGTTAPSNRGHHVAKPQVFISWAPVQGSSHAKRVTMIIVTPEEPYDPDLRVAYREFNPKLDSSENPLSGIAVVERFAQELPPEAGGPAPRAGEIGLRLCEDARGFYPKPS